MYEFIKKIGIRSIKFGHFDDYIKRLNKFNVPLELIKFGKFKWYRQEQACFCITINIDECPKKREVTCMPGILTAIGFLVKEFYLLVSYVKNNAFPQPLSSDDEKKYLKLMSEGDGDARNILIEHNLRLVAHIVKKFENTGEDSEDLISIGTIGLIKAIESYSDGKGTKLATYAARCIENEISMTKRGCVNLIEQNE